MGLEGTASLAGLPRRAGQHTAISPGGLGQPGPWCHHRLGPCRWWETDPSSHGVPGEMRWAQGLCAGLGRAAQSSTASRDRVKSMLPASLPLLEMDPWFQNDSASPLNLYFTSEKLCIMQIVR